MSAQGNLPGIPVPPPAPPAFSISKINLYLKCPAAYYFRHVLGLRTPPRSYQVFGTSLHAGIAHNYRKKMETQMDLPLGQVQEFFSADWDYQRGKILWEPGEDAGKMKDEGIKLLEVYQARVAPAIQPAVVEEMFEIQFEGVPYTFRGIIDLVDRKSGMVIDHKTTTKTPSAVNVHKDLQLTAYSMGNRVKHGVVEKGMAFDYIVRSRSPKIVRIETSRSEEDIKRFLRLMANVATAIQEQRFYPNPSHPYCSPKLCAYWDACEGGRKFDYAPPAR